MISRFHFVVFTTLAALPGLSIVASRAHAKEPSPEITLRFLFLDETPGAYSLKLGATYRQVSATPYMIGGPVTTEQADRLELYKDGPPDPATGKPLRLKIATLNAPADTSSALVVITPRPPAPGTTTPVYTTAFFDNDPRAFPPRSIRILNLGQAPMAAQFGSAQVITQPGASQIIQPTVDPRNRVFGKIAVQTPTGWELLYNRITVLRSDERVTGVFVYSPSGLRHTYTSREIEENGPPPPGHFWLTYGETSQVVASK
jgi:hypothetical protein